MTGTVAKAARHRNSHSRIVRSCKRLAMKAIGLMNPKTETIPSA